MRAIKFRVWDKVNRVMVPLVWPEFRISNPNRMLDDKRYLGLELYYNNNFGHAPEIAKRTEKQHLVVAEWTGLTDREGREVYEGDIVRFQYRDFDGDVRSGVSPVVFEDGAFGVESDDFCNMRYSDNFELEVIGNIYK